MNGWLTANSKNDRPEYILTSDWKDPNMGYVMATLGPLARSLKENYPTLVADYYRFDGLTVTVAHGGKDFREELQLGDSTLLTMYGLSLLPEMPVRPSTILLRR